MDYIVVFIVGLLAGGFAVSVGFALDLNPVAIYVAATAGSLVGLAAFLYGGERLRVWLHHDGGDGDAATRSGLARRGPRLLGLIGPTFPGVTASAVIGLAAGFDRAELARWMTVGITALYAAYTVGLWVLSGL